MVVGGGTAGVVAAIASARWETRLEGDGDKIPSACFEYG